MDADPRMLVAELDLAAPDAAMRELQPCCASTAWLDAVVSDRPYGSLEALLGASGAALAKLRWVDVLEAISVHGRIGADPADEDRQSAWSRGEQSGLSAADASTRQAMQERMARYEQQFGHVYLVCAEDLDADQMLDDIDARLANDPSTEQDVVRRELARIVDLRVRTAFR